MLVNDFKDRERGGSEEDAVAQWIAQLGEEGWEIAGISDNSYLGNSSIYFKRPVPTRS